MCPDATAIKNTQSTISTMYSIKSDKRDNIQSRNCRKFTNSTSSEIKNFDSSNRRRRPPTIAMTLNSDTTQMSLFSTKTTPMTFPLSSSTPPVASSQPPSVSASSSLSSSSSSSSRTSSYAFVVVAGLLLFLLINISCVEASKEHSSPMNLEGKVGSYVVFNCRVDFPYDYHIPYVVHWSKDNKKIFTWYDGDVSTSELFSGRLSLVDNHGDYGKASANLTSIRESDQGLYHCQIVFPNRTPSYRNNGTFFQLTVEGGSLIKIPPINQTIMEGQTAFFHCVMKYPNTSNVTWYKDAVALYEQQDLQRRSRMGPDGSLSIDPTMMSDLGEYECTVQNNVGEVQTAKAYLNIQYKAKVIYSPPEVYLPYGQPAVLDCHFRSNPPLKNLRWEKDGLLFDSYNVPGVFYKMNGSLFFSKVDENHSGSYTCTPYNELGTDGPSPIINVIVQRPPIFTINPKPIYIHKLGENAQLSCEASERDGNHLPTMGWTRKDGIPLPEGRYKIEGGNLTIEGIVESDRGIYECSATNGAATITADTELMIENVAPRPPHNLTANSTETAITVRWQPGYLRPNLEYIVWYRLSDAAEWRTMRILTKNVMEATIKNLIPGREYEFMVLSQDRYGDGMFSKLFRYSTKGSDFSEPEQFHDPVAPSTRIGPPRNLTALENSHGYLLHWDPPIHGLDSLRLYVIQWWREPEHYLIGSAETIDTYYQLRHLKEDAIYKVQIYSQAINGDKEPSNELEIVVPSHRKMRAVVIGSAVGLIFLVTAFCAFLYVKRSCFRHLKSNNDKMNDT